MNHRPNLTAFVNNGFSTDMRSFAQFVDCMEKWLNELSDIEFQDVFDKCIRKPGMHDVFCTLTTRYRIGIGCLFKPDAIPDVVIGCKAMQHMTNELTKSCRDHIAPDWVPLVARRSHDAFQQFPEKPVAWEMLNEINLQSIDIYPRSILSVGFAHRVTVVSILACFKLTATRSVLFETRVVELISEFSEDRTCFSHRPKSRWACNLAERPLVSCNGYGDTQ